MRKKLLKRLENQEKILYYTCELKLSKLNQHFFLTVLGFEFWTFVSSRDKDVIVSPYFLMASNFGGVAQR